MEDTPAVQLIAVEIQNPDFVPLLNDIRDFDWKIVNRLRKEDIARIHSTGFNFRTKGLENQKMEFKSFLFEHPSVMASDFEMIISKLNIYARMLTLHNGQSPQASKSQERSRSPPSEHEAIKFDHNDRSLFEYEKKPKNKKRKQKVIVIEEESESESYEPESDGSSDVEYVHARSKRKRLY